MISSHLEKIAPLRKLKQGTLSECVFAFAAQEECHAGEGRISSLGEGSGNAFFLRLYNTLHTTPQAPQLRSQKQETCHLRLRGLAASYHLIPT